MANPYDKFAPLYDKMEADHHSINMVKYCFNIFDKFSINPEDALDLCCGTGTALKLFAQRGIKMSGLDQSRQMLKVARKKAGSKTKYKAKFYCQSLPCFEILANKPNERKKLKRFDLVTSFYDSLNYMLTENDLKKAFHAVYRHLKPGGHFIFDMNTPNALKTIWSSQVYAGSKKDIAWIFENDYMPDKQMADCHTTFFVKEGKFWKRYDETHRERGYSDRVIKSLLRSVGFKILGYYRCNTFQKPAAKTNRIAVVVQRV